MENNVKHDAVNRPKHYQSPFPIEINTNDVLNPDKVLSVGYVYIQALDVIKAWGLYSDFCLGNVIKYILRAGKKDDQTYLQDLKKARFYLDEKIRKLEAQNENTLVG